MRRRARIGTSAVASSREPLEAVGQLASGVAPEINTPIQYISDSVQFIHESYSNIARLDSALLEALRPRSRSPPADINAALTSTLAVARNEHKYIADVTTELAELPPLPCRVHALNQVFLTLIVNAAHAIEERAAGTACPRGAVHMGDIQPLVEWRETSRGTLVAGAPARGGELWCDLRTTIAPAQFTASRRPYRLSSA